MMAASTESASEVVDTHARSSDAPASIDPSEISSEGNLWLRWTKWQDPEARAALAERHLDFAKMLAATAFARRTHNDIEFADYFQLASVGMLEAIDRFDPGREILFRTFASKRIQGAILNGLDRLTEKNQQISVRRRLRKERLASIKDEAFSPLGEEKTARDGVRGDTPEALFRYLAEVGVGIALGVLLEGSGMVDPEAFGSDATSGSPEAKYFRDDEIRVLQRAVRDMVARLTDKEQSVIQSHYLHEMPFERIAKSMGVTRGRVSQLHRQALEKLRLALQGRSYADMYG